jgi:hypothetical protein
MRPNLFLIEPQILFDENNDYDNNKQNDKIKNNVLKVSSVVGCCHDLPPES